MVQLVLGQSLALPAPYEQYRFTGDKEYLRNVAYSLIKGAADFTLDWLIEQDGALVTAPSTSPENVCIHPKGFKGTVTIASAMAWRSSGLCLPT